MVSVMHVHAKIVESVLTVWTKRSSMVLDAKKKQCCVERKCRNLVQLTKQPSDIPSSLRDTTACTSLQTKPGSFTNTIT